MLEPLDDYVAEKAFACKHHALRNALYHSARRGYLDGWNRLFNLLTIVAGTSSAATLTQGHEWAAVALGASIAFIGALQLVLDFGGRARTHDFLQRRYYEMLADIERLPTPTLDQCADWASQFAKLAADEPPTLRALDAIADNQATQSLKGGNTPRLRVEWWQSATRHLVAHNAGLFPDETAHKKLDKTWSEADVWRSIDDCRDAIPVRSAV